MNNQTITAESYTPKQSKHGLFTAYCELTKIKLSLLVVMSTAVAFVMASELGIEWLVLLWTVIGTTLSAAAAAVWNQLIERKRDAVMDRTKNRPIPTGRISSMHAFITATLLTYAGLSVLAFGANPSAAGISLLTLLTYLFIYTPLKPQTTFNTFVGAVVGAFPPLLGWVAATGTLSGGAWIIAGILFMWQIPHFMALAWKYKDDYEKGGFIMLPAIDPTGTLTGRVSVITAMCLVPLCLLFTNVGTTSVVFAIGGSALSLWYTYVSFLFWRVPSNETASRMFLTSISYLPLLFILMLLTRKFVDFNMTALVTT